MSQKQSNDIKDIQKSIQLLKRLYNHRNKNRSVSCFFHMTAVVDSISHLGPQPNSTYIDPIVIFSNITIDKYKITFKMYSNYSRQLVLLGELHKGDKLNFLGRIQRARTNSGYKLSYVKHPYFLNHKNIKRLNLPDIAKYGEEFIGYICKRLNIIGKPNYTGMIQAYKTWRKYHIKQQNKVKRYFNNARKQITPKLIKQGREFFTNLLKYFGTDFTKHEYVDIPNASILQIEWLSVLNIWSFLHGHGTYHVLSFDNRYVCQIPYFKKLRGESIKSPLGWRVIQFKMNQIYKLCHLNVNKTSKAMKINKFRKSISAKNNFIKEPTQIKATITPDRVVIFKAPKFYSVMSLLRHHKKGMKDPNDNFLYELLHYIKNPRGRLIRDSKIYKDGFETAKLIHSILSQSGGIERITFDCYGCQLDSLVAISLIYDILITDNKECRKRLCKIIKKLYSYDIWTTKQCAEYLVFSRDAKNSYDNFRFIILGIEMLIAIIRWRYMTHSDLLESDYHPIFEQGGQQPLPIDFKQVMSYVRNPKKLYLEHYDYFKYFDEFQMSHRAHQIYDCLKNISMTEHIKKSCNNQEFIGLKFIALAYFRYETTIGGQAIVNVLEDLYKCKPSLVPDFYSEEMYKFWETAGFDSNLRGVFLILEYTIMVLHDHDYMIPRKAMEWYRKGAKQQDGSIL